MFRRAKCYVVHHEQRTVNRKKFCIADENYIGTRRRKGTQPAIAQAEFRTYTCRDHDSHGNEARSALGF